MSEHVEKAHPAGAIVMVLIIAALVTWGISLMNDGDIVSCAVAGVLVAAFGIFASLSLGKE